MGDHVGILDVVLKISFCFFHKHPMNKLHNAFYNRYYKIQATWTGTDQYPFHIHLSLCFDRQIFFHFERGRKQSHQVRKTGKHRNRHYIGNRNDQERSKHEQAHIRSR